MQIKFTFALTLLLIALFAAEVAFPTLVDALAFLPSEFFARPWSALTAIFVHADIKHLVANLVTLWFFGFAVEREIGRKNAASIFVLSAVAGEFVAALTYPIGTQLIGASGGIFGLLGFAMIVRPLETEIPTGWPSAFPIPLLLVALLYIAYNIIGVFAGPYDIAYGAHFAGLAVGLAAGMKHRMPATRRKSRRAR